MVSLNEKRVGGILFIKTNKYSWLLILWIWRTLPSMVNNIAHTPMIRKFLGLKWECITSLIWEIRWKSLW